MRASGRFVFIESVLVAAGAALTLCGLVLIVAPGAATRFIAHVGAGRAVPGGSRIAIAAEKSLPEPALGAPDQPDGYTVQFAHSESFEDAVTRVRDGGADAGYALSIALAGQEGLAGVANLGRRHLHVIVPAGAAVQGLADLAGTKVGTGHADAYAIELFSALLESCAPANPPQLTTEHNADLEEAFLEGQIGAALLLCGHNEPIVTELFATGWYTLVPIPEAEALALRIPGLFADVIPAGLYGPEHSIPPPESGPLPTVAVTALLYARVDAADAKVEALARRAQKSADAREAGAVAPLALHPAAVQFAAGAPPPRPESGRAMALLLGCLCLLTGAQTLWGRARKRRTAARRQALLREAESLLRECSALTCAEVVEIPGGMGPPGAAPGSAAQGAHDSLEGVLPALLARLRSQQEALRASDALAEVLRGQLASALAEASCPDAGPDGLAQPDYPEPAAAAPEQDRAGEPPQHHATGTSAAEPEPGRAPRDQMTFGF